MAEGQIPNAPSFGRLVLGRAISDTVQFLQYTKRDVILALVTLVLGGILAYVFVGKADTVKEFVFIAAFTFAPAGIVMFCVFIWHLWLAPNAMAYEATKVAIARPRIMPTPAPPTASINWEPWKRRSEYKFYEFAKILAKSDPGSSSMDTQDSAYLNLLKDAAHNDNLDYVVEYDLNEWNGTRHPRTVDSFTGIKRDTALAWADENKFPVDHIR